MANKTERYVAAAAYLFDAGYILSWLTYGESKFVDLHFKKANKLIGMLVVPAVIVFLAGLFIEKIFLITSIVALVLIVIYLLLGIWNAKKAFQGKTK